MLSLLPLRCDPGRYLVLLAEDVDPAELSAPDTDASPLWQQVTSLIDRQSYQLPGPVRCTARLIGDRDGLITVEAVVSEES